VQKVFHSRSRRGVEAKVVVPESTLKKYLSNSQELQDKTSLTEIRGKKVNEFLKKLSGKEKG